jgi:hypothetical protein
MYAMDFQSNPSGDTRTGLAIIFFSAAFEKKARRNQENNQDI